MVRMRPFRGRQKEPMGAISPDLYIGCGEPLDPLFYWVFLPGDNLGFLATGRLLPDAFRAPELWDAPPFLFTRRVI